MDKNFCQVNNATRVYLFGDAQFQIMIIVVINSRSPATELLQSLPA